MPGNTSTASLQPKNLKRKAETAIFIPEKRPCRPQNYSIPKKPTFNFSLAFQGDLSSIKTVLENASADQLKAFELSNPELKPETADFWKNHCEKTVNGGVKAERLESESWREAFLRLQGLQDTRLAALISRINNKVVDAKAAVRTAKSIASLPIQKAGNPPKLARRSFKPKKEELKPIWNGGRPRGHLLKKTRKMAKASMIPRRV
ncbi:hypothetical protein L596_020231 [Steinernema carpocapsae]|uniref:Uncharacterized protein n=1 Tax=Steinernema carpocapsae TaxID=34508 RepID=A0A4U5MSX4_STECR|nr:hypothetical protein L596_020231 [Steinernema carpocapsae]